MARIREYDPELVLDLAMKTFWKEGYEGTSIRALAKACNLTTRSMYNAYPDKDKFFEATLDHYYQKVLNPILQILESRTGFSALEKFVKILGNGSTSEGCLYFNTSGVRHLVSVSAVRKIDRYLRRLKLVIQAKLEEAKASGSFSGNSDLRSDQIVANVMGFVQSLRAGIAKEKASAALAQVIIDIQNE